MLGIHALTLTRPFWGHLRGLQVNVFNRFIVGAYQIDLMQAYNVKRQYLLLTLQIHHSLTAAEGLWSWVYKIHVLVHSTLADNLAAL